MISVIIPFFNSENTINRCVQSVLCQTYQDLEILLIDDGSSDRSKDIAVEFVNKDKRIKLFHKENGGLSSARNYGLDRSNGEYVAFVDADDWMEPKAFETALEYIGDSDICVFGRSTDCPGYEKKWVPSDSVRRINREEAIEGLIIDKTIQHVVWDKLYKRTIFSMIRFPEGFNYEDIRTTYKILQTADSIILIPEVLYHYVQYKGSITHFWSIKNLLDRWMAYYELYQTFSGYNDKYHSACLSQCVLTIAKIWAVLWTASKTEQEDEHIRIADIIRFSRLKKYDTKNIFERSTLLLVSTGSRWSMLILYIENCIYRMVHPYRLYTKTNFCSSGMDEVRGT